MGKQPHGKLPPYSERNYIAYDDLVDPEIRGDHLTFNTHLHREFAGEQFIPVHGEEGCFIAFSYTVCRDILNDAVTFSSNPFPDERLVALNTMGKADHSRVLRYVHSHYTQAEIERLEASIRAMVERCTDELEKAGQGADAMVWARRIHMAGSLTRLGVAWEKDADNPWSFVDELVGLNDAMVALVAPLGGVGRKHSELPRFQLLRVCWGLLRSVGPVLAMALRLGWRCTWEIIRPDATVLWPPRKPRTGLWWRPELLPLVPRYFLALHRLLQSGGTAGGGGPLDGIRGGVASGDLRLAEALTLLVQLMVNMTSANALGSLLYRLATERAATGRLGQEPGLAAAFIREVLRLDAPLQRNPRRVASLGSRWSGGPLKVGDQVLVLIGAANMDPAVFEDPEAFRLDRSETPAALTFGSGLHYCLGTSLVKLEMSIALDCLLRRFEAVRLHSFERLANIDVGNWGFQHLHVSLDRKHA